MYKELQRVWVEGMGLKVGDNVKVLRKFKDEELGSIPDWNPEISKTIGEVGEVNYIYATSIGVKFGEDYWNYPFTVLEKVDIEEEEEPEPDVPDTDRDVLFLNNSNEWEIGFYSNDSGCWKVRGAGSGFLNLAEGKVVRWEELPSKEKK